MTFRLPITLTRASLFTLAIVGTLGLAPSARGQGLISQWMFPNSPPFDITSPAPTTDNAPTSSAFLIGGTSGSAANDVLNALNAAWQTSSYPTQSTASGTAGVQFNVRTNATGLTDNLVVRFDQRQSNSSSRFFRLEYTRDGTNFTSAGLFNGGFGAGVYEANAGGDVFYTNRTFDLSGISAANNNANFAVRMVAIFDPANNSAYTSSAPATGYGTTGTNRFDNVTVTAANRWIGGTGTDLSTAANYAGTTPAAPTATSTLLFNGTTNLTATAASPLSVGQILFGTGAGAYTLSGDAITATGGVVNQSASSQTIGNALVLGNTSNSSAQTIYASTAGTTLTLNGNVTTGLIALLGPGSNAQLFVNGPGNVTINGALTNASGTITNNSLFLRKTGTGTLLLNSNANSFSGSSGTPGSRVDSGTIGGSGTLSGNLTVASGATVLAGQGTAVGETFTVSGSLTLGTALLTDSLTFENVVGNGAGASDLTTTGASLINVGGTLGKTDAATDVLIFELTNDGSLNFSTTYTRRLATYTSGSNLTPGTYTTAGIYNVIGSNFTIDSWSLVVGTNFIDLTFTPIVPVPEPGTVLAVAAGGLGLVRVVRRRRAAAAPAELAA